MYFCWSTVERTGNLVPAEELPADVRHGPLQHHAVAGRWENIRHLQCPVPCASADVREGGSAGVTLQHADKGMHTKRRCE